MDDQACQVTAGRVDPEPPQFLKLRPHVGRIRTEAPEGAGLRNNLSTRRRSVLPCCRERRRAANFIGIDGRTLRGTSHPQATAPMAARTERFAVPGFK
jgi:hypothetical protein